MAPTNGCRSSVTYPDHRYSNWESKFGCCAAVSLTVLEVKRLLLLVVEMLIDLRTIQFAAAHLPVVFSFVDVGIGFPVAVAALCAIRKYKLRPCYPNTKRTLRRVALMLTICAILNVITIILITCYIDTNADSLREAFKAYMRFYARKVSHKATVDELQLDLQCCGHSSYTDWFTFDWQGTSDYGDSDSKEEYGDRSIPFSCCSKRTILPCIHAEMQREDVRTVNGHGCAVVLSRILFKIVVVGCAMTGLIICTQILIILFLIKIIRKVLPEICPSDCSCWESPWPLNQHFNYSSDETLPHSPERIIRCRDSAPKKIRPLARPVKICRRPRIIRKFCGSTTPSKCSTSRSPRTTSWSSDSSSTSLSRAKLTSSPSFTIRRPAETAGVVAPSARVQHELPQNRKREK